MATWSKKEGETVHAGRGILRKLLPSGVWHLFYKNESGRWVSKSTGHRDKSGAITWAESFSMDLTRKDFGIAPVALRADDRIELALDAWLEYQKSQNTAYTHRTYKSIVKKFKRFLTEQTNLRRLRSVTTQTMMDFRQWAVGLGNDRVTVDNNLIALRSFFSWAKSKGLVAANPVSQQRHGQQIFFDAESPRKETYTPAEYESIRSAAKGTSRAVYTILANTGLRSTELAMLEWTDIDLRNNLLHVRRKTTCDGLNFVPKDKTDRTVPLTVAVRTTFDELAPAGNRAGYLIPLPAVKSRADYFERTFLERLKDLHETTGIGKPKLTLHNFRRFFVSQCADSNVPLATVMDWVGHDEMKMVLHYYRLRDEAAQRAIERFTVGQGGAAQTASSSPAQESSSAPQSEQDQAPATTNKDESAPAAAPTIQGSEPVRKRKCGGIDQRSTTPDSSDHLWSEPAKKRVLKQKQGKTERAGFVAAALRNSQENCDAVITPLAARGSFSSAQGVAVTISYDS